VSHTPFQTHALRGNSIQKIQIDALQYITVKHTALEDLQANDCATAECIHTELLENICVEGCNYRSTLPFLRVKGNVCTPVYTRRELLTEY
jgi:hypothetical protein